MKLWVAPESTRATASFQPAEVLNLTASEKCRLGDLGTLEYGRKSKAEILGRFREARTWNRGTLRRIVLKRAPRVTPEQDLLLRRRWRRGLRPFGCAEVVEDAPGLGGKLEFDGSERRSSDKG
jgi:hypothetical protein